MIFEVLLLAGDEVLISDLVMEGLLTAYEMELPDGIPESYREQIVPALLTDMQETDDGRFRG